jgi:hypothetical protein
VRHILDLDAIRSPQIAPNCLKLSRDLIFVLVVLNGDGERVRSIRRPIGEVSVKRLPHQPVEADRQPIARSVLLGVDRQHESSSTPDKLPDKPLHEGACVLNVSRRGDRRIFRNAARNVNPAAKEK